MIIRIVCAVLAAAIILGVLAHPPATFGQSLSALLPTALLIGYAIRGPRRRMRAARPKDSEPPPP
ncbi:MAG: hypothetical protein ACJ790_01720 [Myxococcaceae bacterium]